MERKTKQGKKEYETMPDIPPSPFTKRFIVRCEKKWIFIVRMIVKRAYTLWLSLIQLRLRKGIRRDVRFTFSDSGVGFPCHRVDPKSRWLKYECAVCRLPHSSATTRKKETLRFGKQIGEPRRKKFEIHRNSYREILVRVKRTRRLNAQWFFFGKKSKNKKKIE